MKPKYNFKKLVEDMVKSDLEFVKKRDIKSFMFSIVLKLKKKKRKKENENLEKNFIRNI